MPSKMATARLLSASKMNVGFWTYWKFSLTVVSSNDARDEGTRDEISRPEAFALVTGFEIVVIVYQDESWRV